MPDDNRPSGWFDRAVTYLAGQPFNNVMLVLIFCGLGYLTYYAVKDAVPAHLRQIQAGYERQAESYERGHTRDHELIRGLLRREGIHIPVKTGTGANFEGPN